MRGPLPFDAVDGDGCTKSPETVPHHIGGTVSVSLACLFHDYAYYIGGTESDRAESDRCLLVNMVTLGADASVALVYYRAARVFGCWGSTRGWQYRSRPWVVQRVAYSVLALFGR